MEGCVVYPYLQQTWEEKRLKLCKGLKQEGEVYVLIRSLEEGVHGRIDSVLGDGVTVVFKQKEELWLRKS